MPPTLTEELQEEMDALAEGLPESELSSGPVMTVDDFRQLIQGIARKNGDYAGYPMPVPGLDMNLEPRLNKRQPPTHISTPDGEELDFTAEPVLQPLPDYKQTAVDRWTQFIKQKNLKKESRAANEPAQLSRLVINTLEKLLPEIQENLDKLFPDMDKWKDCYHEWWSDRLKAKVCVFRNPKTMKVDHWYTNYEAHSPTTRLSFLINTLNASRVLSAEAELKATIKLADLLESLDQYDQYTLIGAFMETSPRSKVTYVFRRCKPTLALRPQKDGGIKFLAALCLHPIGHYEESWAGVMVPTDDVIAHLLLMRGDERKFWAKAYQHPLWDAANGI